MKKVRNTQFMYIFGIKFDLMQKITQNTQTMKMANHYHYDIWAPELRNFANDQFWSYRLILSRYNLEAEAQEPKQYTGCFF